MRVEWRELTRNHHVAVLDTKTSACIEIYRHRSWEKLGQQKPWRITIFGDCHTFGRQYFEAIDDAQAFAEREASLALKRMSRLR